MKSFPFLELSTTRTPNILREVECSTGEAELQVTAGLVIPNRISKNRRGGVLFEGVERILYTLKRAGHAQGAPQAVSHHESEYE